MMFTWMSTDLVPSDSYEILDASVYYMHSELPSNNLRGVVDVWMELAGVVALRLVLTYRPHSQRARAFHASTSSITTAMIIFRTTPRELKGPALIVSAH